MSQFKLPFSFPVPFHSKYHKTSLSSVKTLNQMSPLPYLSTLLLLIPITCYSAQPFKCSSTGKTCSATLDYLPLYATTFEVIKDLFDVSSLFVLRGANNFPLTYQRNSTVVANQTIRIPFQCACNNGTGLSKGPFYKVAANETLHNIATDVFSGLVTYQQILEANNISDPGLIKEGQRLWVPLPCSCDNVEGREVVHYGHVVAPGSTLGGIAQHYNVSQNTLLDLNDLEDPNDIKAGAILDIPLRACSSMVNNASLDYPLLLPVDTYVHTATNCIICSCNATNNWILQCKPSPVNSSCSPIRCMGEDNLYIGDASSTGCNHTTCGYAGYTERRILTVMTLESTCPASSDESPAVSSDAPELKFLLVYVYKGLLCLLVYVCWS